MTPQMKSVGEAMAIGRTFKESLQKAMRSLETGSFGFEPKVDLSEASRQESLAIVQEKLKNPNSQRLWYVGDAYRLGMTTDEIFQLSAYRSLVPRKNPRDYRNRRAKSQAAAANRLSWPRTLLRRWKADGLCRRAHR